MRRERTPILPPPPSPEPTPQSVASDDYAAAEPATSTRPTIAERDRPTAPYRETMRSPA